MLKKAAIVQKAKTTEHTRTERQVLEHIRQSPFLVTLHYAFQTQSKLHLILGEWWDSTAERGELLSLRSWSTEQMFSLTVCLFVGILYIMCIRVIFVLHVFKPPVYLFVCECRLREWRGDVYSFVPAGSLPRGSRADLYWGNNPGSGAPAQGGFHSFSLWNFRLHFPTLDNRRQKYDEANLWKCSTNILTYIYCRGWHVGSQFPSYTKTQSHISILLESQLFLYFAASVLSTTNYFLCCLKYSLVLWSYSAV